MPAHPVTVAARGERGYIPGMRNLQTLWMAVLLAGCGGPAWDYDAPVNGPSLAVGSGGGASGPSATSAGGSDAQGGAGGVGGALPFVGATGQGGEAPTGEGGAGGGPDLCEPGPNPCDGMPDGACGEWVDSCGAPIVCGNEACSPGTLACHPGLGACVCQDATGYTAAVNACAAMGGGVASECGDDGPTSDTPETCIPTDVLTPLGHVVWCCY